MMRSLRKRQIKYGVTSGVFVFGVLWLLAGFFVPENAPQEVSRWRASLWLLLGMNFIDIWIETGQFTGETVGITELFTDVPVRELRLVPPVAIALAAFYAAREISRTRRPKYVITNAATVLVGYIPALVVAFLVSDANPQLETALMIVSIAAIAIYLGSKLLARLTGGLPFFGIASLGTILLVGLIAFVVAVEVIRTFGPALVMSGVGVTAGAVGVYYLRGGGGVLSFLRGHATILVLFLALSGGLYVVLGGPMPDVEPPNEFSNQSGELFGDDFDGQAVEQEIYERVNEIRTERGLQSLTPSPALGNVARNHSRDMGQRDFYAHDNPDGQGPFDRVIASNASCQAVGENIAYTHWQERVEVPGTGEVERLSTAEEVAEHLVTGWMNSPPHRENILDTRWQSIGVGVHLTDDDRVFATQNFCS